MVSHILEDWLYLCFPACSNVWSWGDWMQLTARALTETNDWGRKYITAFRMCPHHASNNYRRYLDTARWTAPRSSPRRLLGGTWSQKARPLGHTMTPLFFYSANFRFSAPLQWFNLVALLDFNNFIGAIWLKLWRHKRVIGGPKKYASAILQQPRSQRELMKKCLKNLDRSVSCDVITRFGH